MYYKVTRKILKKALVFLKKQPKTFLLEKDILDGETNKPTGEKYREEFPNRNEEYIEEIEFALYKTKLDEFYIDYDFAQAIRPALLTKEIKK